MFYFLKLTALITHKGLGIMTELKSCVVKKFKVVLLEQELAYSFHLSSDKNKSKLAKKFSKGNVPGTTYLSNKQLIF